MNKKNIYIIIGARPQFIKYAPLSNEIKKIENINLIVVHTGQHYDNNMSKIFFENLNIDSPNINLNINDVSRGQMIGEMIKKIDFEFDKSEPDIVVLFGDTNSTLAGSVAASSYDCEIIHVESGLRSYNKNMPEEHNRIVADHLSTILCVASQESKINLLKEGIPENKIFFTGDIMLDTFVKNKDNILTKKTYDKMGLIKNRYIVATIHRKENTSNKEKLHNIFTALNTISKDIFSVVLPIHPATKKALKSLDIDISHIKMIDPCDYSTFLSLVSESNFVITDSGGLQKDAYYLKKKTLVCRTESEWPELKKNNASILIDPSKLDDIMHAVNQLVNSEIIYKDLYGNGSASKIINKIILNRLKK